MSAAVSRAVTSAKFTMSGSFWVEGTVSIATSATAVPLGQVTAPGWCYFHNLDATNYLTVRNGASGADLLKLAAGEYAFFPMYDSATPYAAANSSACLLEYLIFSR